ncbi:hypothetical protein F5Y18DRAFT_75383 [Xylariaceae sp. FL1019]|nr:hypothetical protein F5Y18DRAFT_75383 [Xylariaceae sp. FL1019]
MASAEVPISSTPQPTTGVKHCPQEVLLNIAIHLQRPCDVYSFARANKAAWCAAKQEILIKDILHWKDFLPRHLSQMLLDIDVDDLGDEGYHKTLRLIQSDVTALDEEDREVMHDIMDHNGSRTSDRRILHTCALVWFIQHDQIPEAIRTIDLAKRYWPSYINTPDPDGALPIHIATARGQAAVVENLLNKKICHYDLPVGARWGGCMAKIDSRVKSAATSQPPNIRDLGMYMEFIPVLYSACLSRHIC